MIPLLIEAAMRSLLVALAVWAGLRAFRVSNVLAQKAAWGLVLVVAFAMPMLLPLAARLPSLPVGTTLMIPSHPRAAFLGAVRPAPRPVASSASQFDGSEPSSSERSSAAAQDISISADRFPAPTISSSNTDAPLDSTSSGAFNPLRSFSLRKAAWLIYFIIAGALLLRLMMGLVAAISVWQTAEHVSLNEFSRLSGDTPLRASRSIASPVTIGSAVLLPANYHTWGSEKLRIVLAHERSHIRQGDFYLQLLAGIYAALFWFSPLGWWVKRKLSDLAEAISDRAGLEEAASRSSYAQVLLEFAATPRRPALIGVPMARTGSLSRRIERLLNDTTFRQAFADSRRRVLVAALLVPVALFAATEFIRVQAATQVPQQQPASMQISVTGSSDPGAAALPSPANATLPASPETLAAIHAVPQTPQPVLVAARGGHALIQSAQSASEATFDRTLTISGKLELHIANASGNIHLTRGSANQVRIHGRVRSEHASDAEQVRALAANPPIEQSGNTIHIGGKHEHGENHISIDYDIEAPADATLEASSGSGDITDEGVGQGAKLETGSGNINATGLQGGFKIETGSGNIAIDEAGAGDAKAETGSGNIEIKGVHGGLKAETGSGDIKAAGTPSSDWKLETGSGNIEFSPGNAPLTLDASTGSGGIATDHEMAMQVSSDRHRLHGDLNGGGPAVRIETGSGDIRIH